MNHVVRRFFSAVAASARSLAVGLVLTCGMMALYIIQPDILRQVDNKIYDAALALLPSGEPSPVPVIVDIDEPSLRELGQWPWPRYQMARLVTALYADGALAVALDILPAEADRTSPLLLQDNLRRDLGFDVSFEHLPPEYMDNDRLFAETLRHTPIVLGAYLDFSGRASAGGKESLLLPRIVEQRPAGALPPRGTIMRATCLDLPLPELAKAAPVGFINAAPGVDNVIRIVPLREDGVVFDREEFPIQKALSVMVPLPRKRVEQNVRGSLLNVFPVGGVPQAREGPGLSLWPE